MRLQPSGQFADLRTSVKLVAFIFLLFTATVPAVAVFLPGDQDGFCFCARHVAGGMPNWLMNHRVNELAIE